MTKNAARLFRGKDEKSPIKDISNLPSPTKKSPIRDAFKLVTSETQHFASTGVQTMVSTSGPAPNVTMEDLCAARPTATYWRNLTERFLREIDEERKKAFEVRLCRSNFQLSCELMAAREEEQKAKEKLEILLEVLQESIEDGDGDVVAEE